MMLLKYMGNGEIYIAFPVNLKSPHNDFVFPPGVEEWMKENNIPNNPGIIKGKQVGIFLNEQDATAFKLRFKL